MQVVLGGPVYHYFYVRDQRQNHIISVNIGIRVFCITNTHTEHAHFLGANHGARLPDRDSGHVPL